MCEDGVSFSNDPRKRQTHNMVAYFYFNAICLEIKMNPGSSIGYTCLL